MKRKKTAKEDCSLYLSTTSSKKTSNRFKQKSNGESFGLFGDKVFVMAVYRICKVCSSCIIASDCPSQGLTAWKSYGLSVTTLLQNVSRSTKSIFLILPQCSTVPFCFSVIWFYVFDPSLKPMKETYTFSNYLLVLPTFIPQIVLVLKFENIGRIF